MSCICIIQHTFTLIYFILSVWCFLSLFLKIKATDKMLCLNSLEKNLFLSSTNDSSMLKSKAGMTRSMFNFLNIFSTFTIKPLYCYSHFSLFSFYWVLPVLNSPRVQKPLTNRSHIKLIILLWQLISSTKLYLLLIQICIFLILLSKRITQH